MPLVVDATHVVPSRDNRVFVVGAVLKLDLFGLNIEQESHPVSRLPVVTIEEHMDACAFATKAFSHRAFECAVDGDDSAALVACEGGVTVSVAIVPCGENHRVVGFAIIHLSVVLNTNVATGKTESLDISALVVGIFRDLHLIVNPVEGVASREFAIAAPKSVEVKRRHTAPCSQIHRICSLGIGGGDGEIVEFGVRLHAAQDKAIPTGCRSSEGKLFSWLCRDDVLRFVHLCHVDGAAIGGLHRESAFGKSDVPRRQVAFHGIMGGIAYAFGAFHLFVEDVTSGSSLILHANFPSCGGLCKHHAGESKADEGE